LKVRGPLADTCPVKRVPVERMEVVAAPPVIELSVNIPPSWMELRPVAFIPEEI
jgi:hypothetical protein